VLVNKSSGDHDGEGQSVGHVAGLWHDLWSANQVKGLHILLCEGRWDVGSLDNRLPVWGQRVLNVCVDRNSSWAIAVGGSLSDCDHIKWNGIDALRVATVIDQDVLQSWTEVGADGCNVYLLLHVGVLPVI